MQQQLQLILSVSQQFELLICVEDESDPAIMIAKSLIEKYPGVDAKLFIGESLNSDLAPFETKIVFFSSQAAKMLVSIQKSTTCNPATKRLNTNS